MSHESGGGDGGGGGVPDFLGGLVEAAKNTAGGGFAWVKENVGGVVDHVTPDHVNPFGGGGGGGGGAPDVPGLVAGQVDVLAEGVDRLDHGAARGDLTVPEPDEPDPRVGVVLACGFAALGTIAIAIVPKQVVGGVVAFAFAVLFAWDARRLKRRQVDDESTTEGV